MEIPRAEWSEEPSQYRHEESRSSEWEHKKIVRTSLHLLIFWIIICTTTPIQLILLNPDELTNLFHSSSWPVRLSRKCKVDSVSSLVQTYMQLLLSLDDEYIL